MASDAALNVRLGAKTAGFDKAMKRASARVKRFGRSMKRVGSNMTRNFTMPIALIGVASVKMSLDFEKSMTKVNTLVGVSKDEVDKLKKSVLELSGKTATAPIELAEGLYFLTSAGLSGADAMEALEQVSKGVAAGLGESADLANVAAAAQNAYGKESMSASKALDIFGGMVKTGMFNAADLSKVLGQQLGLAATLGISFEEVGAMISTYTKTTGDANSATTGLSGVMMSFAKITPKQAKALADVGMSADSLKDSLSKKGLQATLIDMQKRFAANGIEMSEFFSKSSSLKAVLGVLGNQTETYKDILVDLKDSVGFVNTAFDETTNTSAFKMEKAINDLRVAGTMLGNEMAPIVDALAQKISGLATWFAELDDKGKKNVVMWGGIVAAIGPVLMIIGQISIGIGALIPIVISATTSIRLMTVAMATNPIGLFAIAIAGLTAAFFLHKKEVKETKEGYEDLSKAQTGFLGDIENETAESNRLFTMAKNLNVEGQLRKTVIDQINTAYGQYLPNLLTEKSSLQDVEAAYKIVNSALINKVALQNQEKEISREAKKYYNQQVDAVKDLGAAFGLTEHEASVLMKSMLKDGGSWAKYTDEFQTMHDELRKTDKMTAMLARTAVTQYTRANNDLGKKIDWIKGRYSVYMTEIMGVNKELKKTPKPKGTDPAGTSDPLTDPAEIKRKEEAAAKVKADAIKASNAKMLQLKRQFAVDSVTNEQTRARLELSIAEQQELDRVRGMENGEALMLEVEKNYTLKRKKLIRQQSKDNIEEINKLPYAAEEAAAKMLESWQKFADKVGIIMNGLSNLNSALSTKETEVLKQQQEEQTAIFDSQMEADAERMTAEYDTWYEDNQKRIEQSLMSEESKAKALDSLEKAAAKRKSANEKTLADKQKAFDEKQEKDKRKLARKQAMRERVLSVANIIMSTASGIMKAVSSFWITGGMPWAGIIAAMGAAQIGTVLSTPLPSLASGGVAFGESVAKVGDYAGASANPEVIAPLDKLKGMIGGKMGNANIKLRGELLGNNIFLSNEKTTIDRLRFI